jgi:hypothetical protein
LAPSRSSSFLFSSFASEMSVTMRVRSISYYS